MNIERPTSNVEWEKMKKQTYDLEERLLKKKNEHRTSNVQLATGEQALVRLRRIERWMGKDEETEFKKPELLDDILQETEELISACPKSPLFVISTKGRNLECQYYQ